MSEITIIEQGVTKDSLNCLKDSGNKKTEKQKNKKTKRGNKTMYKGYNIETSRSVFDVFKLVFAAGKDGMRKQELVSLLHRDEDSVSDQIKVLKLNKLVFAKRQGREMTYFINEKQVKLFLNETNKKIIEKAIYSAAQFSNLRTNLKLVKIKGFLIPDDRKGELSGVGAAELYEEALAKTMRSEIVQRLIEENKKLKTSFSNTGEKPYI